ncbi:hypothetical protein, partial [Acidaminobacter sp. JC074]|uniref:hypothetical protein n=1 Tax=Acidaminobacter sp. JC074 TaxID=2530199 RepID=UPI001F0E7288
GSESVKLQSRSSSRLKNTNPFPKSATKRQKLSEKEGIEEISSSSSDKVTPEKPSSSKEKEVQSQPASTFKYENLKNKSRSLKFWNRESSERHSLFTEKDIWCERYIMFDRHKEVKMMVYDLLGKMEFEKLLDY